MNRELVCSECGDVFFNEDAKLSVRDICPACHQGELLTVGPYVVGPAQTWEGLPNAGWFKLSANGTFVMPDKMFRLEEAKAICRALNDAWRYGRDAGQEQHAND